MQPVDASAPQSMHQKYTSPVGTKSFDRVHVLENARLSVDVLDGRYIVTAAISWPDLHLAAHPGVTLRGDVGFISSNAAGTIDVRPHLLGKPAHEPGHDMPSEAWLARSDGGGLKTQ